MACLTSLPFELVQQIAHLLLEENQQSRDDLQASRARQNDVASFANTCRRMCDALQPILLKNVVLLDLKHVGQFWRTLFEVPECRPCVRSITCAAGLTDPKYSSALYSLVRGTQLPPPQDEIWAVLKCAKRLPSIGKGLRLSFRKTGLLDGYGGLSSHYSKSIHHLGVEQLAMILCMVPRVNMVSLHTPQCDGDYEEEEPHSCERPLLGSILTAMRLDPATTGLVAPQLTTVILRQVLRPAEIFYQAGEAHPVLYDVQYPDLLAGHKLQKVVLDGSPGVAEQPCLTVKDVEIRNAGDLADLENACCQFPQTTKLEFQMLSNDKSYRIWHDDDPEPPDIPNSTRFMDALRQLRGTLQELDIQVFGSEYAQMALGTEMYLNLNELPHVRKLTIETSMLANQIIGGDQEGTYQISNVLPPQLESLRLLDRWFVSYVKQLTASMDQSATAVSTLNYSEVLTDIWENCQTDLSSLKHFELVVFSDLSPTLRARKCKERFAEVGVAFELLVWPFAAVREWPATM